MTSHDVVASARRALSVRRVGHAGTLDPMATGLLILGVGAATRLLGHVGGHDKTYEATIRFGRTTVTDDREGDVLATVVGRRGDRRRRVARPGRADRSAAAGPLGRERGQGRPGGVPTSACGPVRRSSWRRASVTVHSIEVRRIARPYPDLVDADVTVSCSAGTYVRAIARDAGAALGVGGHLTALHRIASGPFGVADAVPVEDAAAALLAGGGPGVLPLADAAATVFPRRTLDDDEARALGYGQRIAATGAAGLHAAIDPRAGWSR